MVSQESIYLQRVNQKHNAFLLRSRCHDCRDFTSRAPATKRTTIYCTYKPWLHVASYAQLYRYLRLADSSSKLKVRKAKLNVVNVISSRYLHMSSSGRLGMASCSNFVSTLLLYTPPCRKPSTPPTRANHRTTCPRNSNPPHAFLVHRPAAELRTKAAISQRRENTYRRV